MTVTSINKKVATASTRSPERQALAAAIDDKTAADEKLEAQRGAVERADAETKLAAERLVSATAAVASAREHHARRVAEAVAAGSHATPATLRAARSAELDAVDDLDAIKTAAESLKAEMEDREAEAGRVAMALEAAVNRVLCAAGLAAVDRLVALRDEIMDLFSVVCFVRERGGERRGPSFYQVAELMEPLAELQEKMATALRVGVVFDNVDGALTNPILDRWTEAVAVLRFDADAELP